VDAIAATQQFPKNLLLRQVKRPQLATRILRLLPDQSAARVLGAVLANTAVPTVLRAGGKVNVVPGVAEAEVDGRSLPGQSTADLVREVRAIVGPDIEVQVDKEAAPLETSPSTPLYRAMERAIAEHHPGAYCIPTLLPGFTDAKQWARLGARCYGFSPVRFPADGPRFADLFHGHDERIPVDGLRWGLRVLHDLVLGFIT
jgi:acetylornithine deacetylase/succinyl-diaminopimelate desuccinylase-like protein